MTISFSTSTNIKEIASNVTKPTVLFHFFTEVERVKVNVMNTGKTPINSGIENILYKRGCKKIEGCLKKEDNQFLS